MRRASIASAALLWASAAVAADKTTAGELVVEPATLVSLGVALPGVNDGLSGRAPDWARTTRTDRRPTTVHVPDPGSNGSVQR